LNPTNYGNLRVNLVMARFLLIDNHVALGIVNISETIENLILKLNSILTIYMTVCYRRTILRSGNVGAGSLSTKKSCIQVDGCADPNSVASRFFEHFARAYSYNNATQADQLKSEFQQLRKDYCGIPVSDVDTIDTELVSHVITDLKRGKA